MGIFCINIYSTSLCVLIVQCYSSPIPLSCGPLFYPSSFSVFFFTHIAILIRVLDVEENLWSPRFGLKGKVDLSLRLLVTPCSSLLWVFLYAACIYVFLKMHLCKILLAPQLILCPSRSGFHHYYFFPMCKMRKTSDGAVQHSIQPFELKTGRINLMHHRAQASHSLSWHYIFSLFFFFFLWLYLSPSFYSISRSSSPLLPLLNSFSFPFFLCVKI